MAPKPVSLTLDRVARALRSPERWTYEGDVRWRAAVAVILRERDGALEVLVIRRAERAGDRWSGHAALPGGKVSESDTSIDDTALRETLEEVGLDLRAIGARRLGQLDDHPSLKQRSWARFTVVPVVYAIEGDPPLTLDAREVAEAMWVPLDEVRRTQGSMLWWFRPVKAIPVKLPMRLPRWQWRGLTIWGLTYGMLRELMDRAESAEP
ncbi:MAG: CoA pyrophosphatase [Deltaproteobacteria bacterium]|jgi:8-oxo-dGTP pyrophosphatase MutT (NUDIX family)|nr:CoA pyrophosphatase [Deltaproteobacteria bacterium]MBK7064021.1 CoA pyrophosphatase [Deltaproteobacteria bacterium]MBK8693426.1 CoA pyrophosphatase [Deltaproteobacteria bacterium]MBP6829545.1 CoA pyrophosphatase [Deltaproteobacteria bacterium]